MKSRTLLCGDGDTAVAVPLERFGARESGVRNRPDDGDAAGLLAREVDKRLPLFQLLDHVLLLSGLVDWRRLVGLSWPMA
jgi:hypothetical protein